MRSTSPGASITKWDEWTSQLPSAFKVFWYHKAGSLHPSLITMVTYAAGQTNQIGGKKNIPPRWISLFDFQNLISNVWILFFSFETIFSLLKCTFNLLNVSLDMWRWSNFIDERMAAVQVRQSMRRKKYKMSAETSNSYGLPTTWCLSSSDNDLTDNHITAGSGRQCVSDLMHSDCTVWERPTVYCITDKDHIKYWWSKGSPCYSGSIIAK